MKHDSPLPALCALLLTLGCAGRPAPASIEPATCGAIEKISRVGDVYLAGQPGPEDLAEARALGVETVINLRGEAEVAALAFDERAVATELGLDYVSLPFASHDELTDAVFDRARDLLDTVDRPILLHCGSSNRVGAVWLPWRVLDEGVSVEEATEEARAIGLRSAEMEKKAKDYIARHRR